MLFIAVDDDYDSYCRTVSRNEEEEDDDDDDDLWEINKQIK